MTDSSISFYKFPINDSDRCITWLINCELDDWVEMSNSELKNKYLCSRHFSNDSFYASDRRRNNAHQKSRIHFTLKKTVIVKQVQMLKMMTRFYQRENSVTWNRDWLKHKHSYSERRITQIFFARNYEQSVK